MISQQLSTDSNPILTGLDHSTGTIPKTHRTRGTSSSEEEQESFILFVVFYFSVDFSSAGMFTVKTRLCLP